MSNDCGIYMIKNKVNGKFYIGSSNNIDSRWKQHINELNSNKHHSYKLQEDWNKYGVINFDFQVLECTIQNNLKDCEQKWIDLLNPHLIGYNILDVSDISKLKDKCANNIEINKKDIFIKIFNKNLEILSKEISQSEAWFIIFLLQYLNGYDCILKTNFQHCSIENIISNSNLKKSMVYDLLKSLIEKDILVKKKSENGNIYLMNPFIFMCGKRVNLEVYEIFKNTKWNNML